MGVPQPARKTAHMAQAAGEARRHVHWVRLLSTSSHPSIHLQPRTPLSLTVTAARLSSSKGRYGGRPHARSKRPLVTSSLVAGRRRPRSRRKCGPKATAALSSRASSCTSRAPRPRTRHSCCYATRRWLRKRARHSAWQGCALTERAARASPASRWSEIRRSRCTRRRRSVNGRGPARSRSARTSSCRRRRKLSEQSHG